MKMFDKMPQKLATGKNSRWSNVYFNLFWSLIDCHRKCDFNQKLSSAHFEGNGRIWRT